MATEKRNLLWLWVEKKAAGAQLHTNESETPKIVKTILDYDSATHHFLIEFEDGEITTIPDKYKFDVEIDDARPKKKLTNTKILKPKD